MWSHRADIAHVLGEDDIGSGLGQSLLVDTIERSARGHQRFDLAVDLGAVRAVGIYDGLHHDRDMTNARRKIALMTNADECLAEPERDDHFGCARYQRADPHVNVPSRLRP
jgi:hypothetical protein